MREQARRARLIAVTSAAGLALYVCWLMPRPFVEVLEWAAVLAIVFHPVHKRIAARPGRPGLAALISPLVVVAVILVPLSLVALALASELGDTA
jgi:predicted PurR-regulated permease PerM